MDIIVNNHPEISYVLNFLRWTNCDWVVLNSVKHFEYDLLKTRTEDLKTKSWKARLNIFSAREIFKSEQVFIDFWTIIYLLEGL